MLSSAAETLALRALAWTAGEGFLDQFLTVSGLDIDELRNRTSDPELLAGFLDYFLSQETLAKGFCEAEKIDPQILYQARHALPGAPIDG